MIITTGVVYTLRDSRSGLICYVGQAGTLRQRVHQHVVAGNRELERCRNSGVFWLPVTVRPCHWLALLRLRGDRPVPEVVGAASRSQDRYPHVPVYPDLETAEAVVYSELRAQGWPLANAEVPRLAEPYRSAGWRHPVPDPCPYSEAIKRMTKVPADRWGRYSWGSRASYVGRCTEVGMDALSRLVRSSEYWETVRSIASENAQGRF